MSGLQNQHWEAHKLFQTASKIKTTKISHRLKIRKTPFDCQKQKPLIQKMHLLHSNIHPQK